MLLFNSRVMAAVVAVALCSGSTVLAQRRGGGEPRVPKPPKQQPHPQGRPGGSPNMGKGPGGGNGPRPVEEFMRMSPDEREKELQKLPPGRQEKLREQLQRYDQMPPEQKQRLQRLWQFPPERQQQIRQSMRDFSQLPQDRRQAMRRQLQQVQGMSPEDRKAYFNSSEFKTQFSPEEQDMMKNLNAIAPESHP